MLILFLHFSNYNISDWLTTDQLCKACINITIINYNNIPNRPMTLYVLATNFVFL